MIERWLILFCFFVSCAYGAEPFRVVLEPLRHTEISAEVTSTVATINKRMGDAFEKGDVLLTLDDELFRLNLQKEQSILERAKAELNAQKRLYDDKAASLLELREAEAKMKVSEADVAKAAKELASCHVIGPYQGIVQDIQVQEFEHVEPGKPLIEILDNHILVAKLLVPSRIGIDLKVGQILNIYVSDAHDSFPAKITHIAPGIDAASNLLKVDSEIDNTKQQLRPGMIGTIDLGT